MKKFLVCLISVLILLGTIHVFGESTADVVQVSKEFIPKRVLTSDGYLWLSKKAVESTNPQSAVCETFPWLRRFDGVKNIVNFSGDAVVDKDGNVWLVSVGSTVKVEKTEMTNVKKVLYYGSEYSVVLKKDGTVCTYRFKLNSDFFPYTEYTYDQRGYDVRIDNVKDIVHYYHGVLALKNDGTVWGIEVGYLRPYPLPGKIRRYGTDESPLDNIVSIFADGGYAIACAKDGSVYGLYGGQLHFGQQHTGKTIEKLPIRDVKDAYLNTWHSIYVKKDGTAWFAGYPLYDDFDLFYKSAEARNPVHNDKYISEITQVDISNVKLVWENGFVKKNNTFWVLGRSASFYDAMGNQTGRVNPKDLDVACLTDEPFESEDTDDREGPDKNTGSSGESENNKQDTNEFYKLIKALFIICFMSRKKLLKRLIMYLVFS